MLQEQARLAQVRLQEQLEEYQRQNVPNEIKGSQEVQRQQDDDLMSTMLDAAKTEQDDEALRLLLAQQTTRDGSSLAGGWHGDRFVQVELHRREDILAIRRALGRDLVLQQDVHVVSPSLDKGVTLEKGLKLLRDGSLRRCKKVHESLAELLPCPWASLRFVRLPDAPVASNALASRPKSPQRSLSATEERIKVRREKNQFGCAHRSSKKVLTMYKPAYWMGGNELLRNVEDTLKQVHQQQLKNLRFAHSALQELCKKVNELLSRLEKDPHPGEGKLTAKKTLNRIISEVGGVNEKVKDHSEKSERFFSRMVASASKRSEDDTSQGEEYCKKSQEVEALVNKAREDLQRAVDDAKKFDEASLPPRTIKFASYRWNCPSCCCPYPVQVPLELTAKDFMARLFPGLRESGALLPVPSDLWLICEAGSPSQPRRPSSSKAPAAAEPADGAGHRLTEMPASAGLHRSCAVCRVTVESPAVLWGCSQCSFFVCTRCHDWAKKENGGSFALVPLVGDRERRAASAKAAEDRCLDLLVRASSKCFDLSVALHFGRLRWPPPSGTDLAAAAQRLCRRDAGGRLRPLADPWDNYVRAALLHAEVSQASASAGAGGSSGSSALPPKTRDRLLHEARAALLAALGVGGKVGIGFHADLGVRQFDAAHPSTHAAIKSQSRAEEAATDARLWYLLGLVLCDLNAFKEARLIYQQVLGRLPMAYFGHVVHFNLACIYAAQPGASARTAALRELKAFRRCCSMVSFQVDVGAGGGRCELCGAAQLTDLAA